MWKSPLGSTDMLGKEKKTGLSGGLVSPQAGISWENFLLKDQINSGYIVGYAYVGVSFIFAHLLMALGCSLSTNHKIGSLLSIRPPSAPGTMPFISLSHTIYQHIPLSIVSVRPYMACAPAKLTTHIRPHPPLTRRKVYSVVVYHFFELKPHSNTASSSDTSRNGLYAF